MEIKSKCELKDKECPDFEMDDYKDLCSSQYSSSSTHCIYSNSVCKEIKKTCLELANDPYLNEEICSEATTSDMNRKKCSLKSDNSGCEEVDKPNQNNQGFENKFSLLLFFIIYSLLL